MREGNKHTVALGRPGLAIRLRIDKYMEQLWLLQQQLTRFLGSLALSQGIPSVSWCQVDGCRNCRSALNPQWALMSPRVVVVVC